MLRKCSKGKLSSEQKWPSFGTRVRKSRDEAGIFADPDTGKVSYPRNHANLRSSVSRQPILACMAQCLLERLSKLLDAFCQRKRRRRWGGHVERRDQEMLFSV